MARKKKPEQEEERQRPATNPTTTVKGRRDAVWTPIQLQTSDGQGATVHITTDATSLPKNIGGGPLEFFQKGRVPKGMKPEDWPYRDRHMIGIYDLPRLQGMTGNTAQGLRQLLKGESLHALTAIKDPRWMALRQRFWDSRTPGQRRMDEGVWTRGHPPQFPPMRELQRRFIDEYIAQGVPPPEAERRVRDNWENDSRMDAYLRAFFHGDANAHEWIATMTDEQKADLERFRPYLFRE